MPENDRYVAKHSEGWSVKEPNTDWASNVFLRRK